MRAPTIVWAASLTLVSLSGPTFTTAEAAPAPQRQRAQQRRYIVPRPRAVRRDDPVVYLVNGSDPPLASSSSDTASAIATSIDPSQSVMVVVSTEVVNPVPAASEVPPAVLPPPAVVSSPASSLPAAVLPPPAVASSPASELPQSILPPPAVVGSPASELPPPLPKSNSIPLAASSAASEAPPASPPAVVPVPAAASSATSEAPPASLPAVVPVPSAASSATILAPPVSVPAVVPLPSSASTAASGTPAVPLVVPIASSLLASLDPSPSSVVISSASDLLPLAKSLSDAAPLSASLGLGSLSEALPSVVPTLSAAASSSGSIPLAVPAVVSSALGSAALSSSAPNPIIVGLNTIISSALSAPIPTPSVSSSGPLDPLLDPLTGLGSLTSSLLGSTGTPMIPLVIPDPASVSIPAVISTGSVAPVSTDVPLIPIPATGDPAATASTDAGLLPGILPTGTDAGTGGLLPIVVPTGTTDAGLLPGVLPTGTDAGTGGLLPVIVPTGTTDAGLLPGVLPTGNDGGTGGLLPPVVPTVTETGGLPIVVPTGTETGGLVIPPVNTGAPTATEALPPVVVPPPAETLPTTSGADQLPGVLPTGSGTGAPPPGLLPQTDTGATTTSGLLPGILPPGVPTGTEATLMPQGTGAVTTSLLAPAPATPTGQSPALVPAGNSTGGQPEGGIITTSLPVQFSVQPTGTDTNTQLVLPTGLLVEPSEAGKPTTTTANGIPTSMPKVIQPPGGKPVKPTNTTLIQLGFYHELNYQFVSTNSGSASQMFDLVPKGLGDGLGGAEVKMQSLQPYDTSKTMGYITTLALLYIPSGMIDQLSVDLHTPNSGLYQNPDPTVATLMSFVNPSIPLLAGQTIGDTSGGSGASSPTSSPGASNGANPFGPDAANGEPVRTSAAAIAAPLAAGAMAYGAAMILVARRYKKKRQSHRRSSSVLSGGDAYMSGAQSGFANSRDSRGSEGTSGRSVRTQQISAPVMSENSLGWN